MGASIRCFFLEPTEYAERSLRRVAIGECDVNGSWHAASVIIGNVPYPPSEYDGSSDIADDRSDPRWPTTCPCGYAFRPTDDWRLDTQRLFRQGDHATLTTTLNKAPAGAMWYGDWYEWRGPDGHCLIVRTPGGDWVVDGPAFRNGQPEGPGWRRTGEVPNVTAQPSIHFIGRWHGWLTGGFLVEC